MLPVIGVDVGGTVEDTWSAKRSWFIPKGIDIGPTPVGRREVVARIGGDEALYEAMVSEVYSDEGIASHDLTDGCAEALGVISTRFRVILMTSRPPHQHAVTCEWLESHGIDGFIDDLYCVGMSRSKIELCRSASARFIVDDDLRHLEAVGLEGVLRAIHYGPGTTFARTYGSIPSVPHWHDVVSIVWRLTHATTITAPGGIEW